MISVKNISKRYRIGVQEQQKDTLVAQIGAFLRKPVDNFRQLRSLSRFSETDESVFWALRDVSFEVAEGEVLGIIGHNGAGKSTLLKILSRITEPSSGEIRMRGRVSSLLEVGTGFHPDLTGRENIYMNGTILGMTRREIDRKFDEIVAFSGIEKHIDTPVKRYSSGMTVRLAFSVAAHLEPEILIIDEVLAVGDAEFQKKCLGRMKDVAGEGRTVLFVSHNMAIIQTLCKNAMLLQKGMIQNNGPVNNVVGEYLKNFNEGSLTKKWNNKEAKSGCYFTSIEVIPEKSENFIMGNNIIINYSVFSEIVFDSFQISVKIYDENYNLVSRIYNTDFLINYRLEKGENEFSQLIKPYNILSGIYYFSFVAMYNYGHQVFDEVDGVIKIEIETRDIIGSGRPFLKDRGMVWFEMENV